MTEKAMWNVFAGLGAFLAALAARKVASLLWARFSDNEPPINPADRSASWAEAAGWAAVAGVTAGVARVLARRGSAAAWESFTGDTPPGVV